MTFLVIVNADDFGLTSGVNRSILSCHLSGSVTSTTLMTNMPACEEAGEIGRTHPSLGVGLHFNLTSGRPISDPGKVPSLTDEGGNLVSRGELMKRALFGALRPEHVETEFFAQIARMKALGLRPSHIDSHQHVHAAPSIFRVVSRAAEAEGVPMRLTWRWAGRAVGKPLRRRLSDSVLDRMTRRCVDAKPASVRTNDGLCSVFDLCEPPPLICERSYSRLLDAYQTGTVELMVHPALVDDELRHKTQITAVSAVEDKLLRSGFLREYVERRGGRLASYRDLA
jgi:chitin disaccharide deacetylase